MADAFRFAAFISYSSKDAEFARKLHRALETYVIPKSLGDFRVTTAARRNKLYPVFRDREEMSAGNLGDLIEQNLRDSGALIVVCSPNSAQSKWVQKEIDYFIALGRRDRVFAIIPEDVPLEIEGRKATTACFPPAFRSDAGGVLSPVAADARKERDGFHSAMLKLVAGVVGCSPGVLADRDRKRRRQRMAIAAAASVIALTGAITTWVNYFHPFVTYAAEYARRDGIWQGVGALSSAAARSRASTYQFRRNGLLNPPTEVRIVNGHGACAAEGFSNVLGHSLDDQCSAARACGLRFTYSRDGQITKEVIEDQYGNAMETLSYSAPSVGQFTEAGFGCSRSVSGIQYVRFTRFAEGPNRGFDQRIEFFHQQGNTLHPRPNNDGSFALEFERDGSGAVLAEWSLGPDGARSLTHGGYAGTVFGRDARGAVIRRSFVDAEGRGVVTSDGVSAIAETHDDAGNVVRRDFLALGDAPAIASERGVSSIVFTYSPRGDVLSEQMLGTDGQPTLTNAGYALQTNEVDRRGYIVAERYFDEAGRPTLHRNGAHLERIERGDTGEPLSVSHFDEHENPTLRRGWTDDEQAAGYHRVTARFDERGNRIEQYYYGVDGRATLESSEQIAGYRKTYDEFNREIEGTSLGVDLRPTPTSTGVFIWRYRYDEHGNLLQTASFDADGNAMPDASQSNAYAVVSSYDEQGRRFQTMGLDAEGRPFAVEEGWTILRSSWNERGDEIGSSYFDADERPILTVNGYHEMRNTYDHAKRRIEAALFGVRGEPVRGANGFHSVRFRFDERGREVERSYHGLRGERISLGDNPTSRIVSTYDARGNRTEYRFYGVDDALVLEPEGTSGWRSEYDARGNETRRTYVGLRDEPVMLPAPLGGYAEFRYQYNLRGYATVQQYFNARGAPTRNLELSTPEREEGYVTLETDYDTLGNVLETRYLDANGHLSREMISSSPRVVQRYDDAGRLVERRLFNADNALANNPTSGRAIVRFSYDDLGRVVDTLSFDAQDRAVDRADYGWHRSRRTYGAGGAVTQTCTSLAGAEVGCE